MLHVRWLQVLSLSTVAVTSACVAGDADTTAASGGAAVRMLRVHPAGTGEVDQALATSSTDFGGLLLTSVQVVPVFWNSGTQFQSNLNAFYKAIPNSTYFDLLHEYGVNRGTGRNGAVDTRSTANVRDSAVQTELARLINAGIVPPPNANTYYPVHFPAGMTITAPDGSQSCVVFCAYHNTFVVGGAFNVNYAVIPDQGGGCAGGCGTNALRVNNLDAVSSGELVDTVSSSDITGPCGGQQTSVVGGDGNTYTVVKFFSNAAGRCVP